MENRDTWLVKLWLANSPLAYGIIRKYAKLVLTMANKNYKQFEHWFVKNTKCIDKINWGNVQWELVQKEISSLAEE